ncbi:hypothetical protein SDC9_159937 [bioreactor metagenome]|uniref:Uncharacterized protein n=1 Tax=bioreactor metagenome TaxID=1076179 RepID=A0A645FGY9_9ZZZZ
MRTEALLEIAAQSADFHGLTAFNKAVFRNCPIKGEKAILLTAVTPAVKNNTNDKLRAFHIV